MSIIAAGTTTTTALSSTGNTDGTIQLQVNGTTPSVTLNALGAIGVGASPAFGTSGQVLISGGSTAAPTWGTPGAATTATNLAGGSNGTIPYQSASGTTQMLAVGTAGQVLQTNGAGAPSWVTVAPAGVTTGTASGSIASGNPVQVNTNGTFSAPTVANAITSLGSETTTSAYVGSYFSLVYMPVPGVYVLVYIDGSSRLAAQIGTPGAGGAVSYANNTIIDASNTAFASAIYTEPNRVVIFWSPGAGSAGRVTPITVTATSITVGNTATTGRADTSGNIAWDSTNSIGMVCGIDGSTGWMFNCAFTLAGATATTGAPVSSNPGGTLNEPNITYDQNSGYFLTLGRNASNNAAIRPSTTTSGRVVTQFTNTQIFDLGGNFSAHPSIVYIPGPNRAFTTFTASNTSYYAYITMTGSTPSVASSFVDTTGGNAGNATMLGYNPAAGLVVSCFKPTGTTASGKVMVVSGTTITLGSAVSLSNSVSSGIGFGNTGRLPYDSVNSRFNVVYGGSSTPVTRTFLSSTSTLTSENFIGFSSAAYTNGQTAVVTTVGGRSTTVTGASVGVKNYVAGTSLTTTNTGIYAGVGLSSTSLLVKG